MSLLKTVFEVNLALFGKREGEKCVSFPFQSEPGCWFKGSLRSTRDVELTNSLQFRTTNAPPIRYS